MKTVYIDSDFKCHVTNDGTMTAIETGLLDGKCDTFIEGCRLIPAGKTWTRNDGTVFKGEMFFPWKSSRELSLAQIRYEKQLLAEFYNKEEELNTAYTSGVNSI